MKKVILCLISSIIIFSAASAFAYDDGYIVKIKDDIQNDSGKISLLNAPSTDILKPIAPEWGMYYVNRDEYNSLDKSLIEYTEPNIDIYMLTDFFSTPNDSDYGLQWNMPLIYAEYAWNFNYMGSGVKVGVIDSGTSPNHPDLKNQIKAAYDFSDGKTIKDNEDADANIGQDKFGHGTKVSGIISAETNNEIGIAGISNADIYSFNIINSSGQGKMSDFLTAMNEAYNLKCDIINMSIGFTVDSNSTDDLSQLKSVNEALSKLNEAGIIVVAASGNNASDPKNTNIPNYPACSEKVISVGAVDKDKKITYYSTHNDMVDISAPGGVGSKPNGVYSTSLNNGYAYDSGTSFAAPHVTAAAAIVKGIMPNLNHDKFEKIIKYTSDKIDGSEYSEYYGFGVLNLKNMIDLTTVNSSNIYLSTPEYDDKTKKISVDIFNPSTESDKKDLNLILCVYSDNTLQCASNIQTISLLPFEEKSIVFDNLNVENNYCVKVMCFTDMHNIKPVARPSVLKIGA